MAFYSVQFQYLQIYFLLLSLSLLRSWVFHPVFLQYFGVFQMQIWFKLITIQHHLFCQFLPTTQSIAEVKETAAGMRIKTLSTPQMLSS